MEFSTYIVQLNDAIILENGPNLAYLLRPTSPHGKDLVKEFKNPTVGDGNAIIDIFRD
jgi:COP9 signalosome complex subunit 12